MSWQGKLFHYIQLQSVTFQMMTVCHFLALCLNKEPDSITPVTSSQVLWGCWEVPPKAFSRLNTAPSASSHTSHAPTTTIFLVPTRLVLISQHLSCSEGYKTSLDRVSEHSLMHQRATYQRYPLCWSGSWLCCPDHCSRTASVQEDKLQLYSASQTDRILLPPDRRKMRQSTNKKVRIIKCSLQSIKCF